MQKIIMTKIKIDIKINMIIKNSILSMISDKAF